VSQKPSTPFCDISNLAILRCKTCIHLITGAACSAFFFHETLIPGLKPGAMDILPFQGTDNIRPARMIFFPAASWRKYVRKRRKAITQAAERRQYHLKTSLAGFSLTVFNSPFFAFICFNQKMQNFPYF
jgi:hypothetical protein